jgi:homoserine kinase
MTTGPSSAGAPAAAAPAPAGAPAAVRVRVPATSANLGPGYDGFGLALARYDEFVAEPGGSGLEIRVTGVGAGDVPLDASHLVVRAAHRAFAALGVAPPGMRLTCRNVIPHGSGLGSSAAAIVGGILLAGQWAPPESVPPGTGWVLELATEMEGHPDNVAPALLGGFTIAWTDATGGTSAIRIPVHPDISAVVFTAESACATSTARALLPERVPHAEAAANSIAAALLARAMEREPALLFEGTRDFLHQPYRGTVMPASAALIDRLRASGMAAVLSGAGPSVLVLTTAPLPADLLQHNGFTAELVGIATAGATVEPA